MKQQNKLSMHIFFSTCVRIYKQYLSFVAHNISVSDSYTTWYIFLAGTSALASTFTPCNSPLCGLYGGLLWLLKAMVTLSSSLWFEPESKGTSTMNINMQYGALYFILLLFTTIGQQVENLAGSGSDWPRICSYFQFLNCLLATGSPLLSAVQFGHFSNLCSLLLIQSSQCFPTMPKTLFSCSSEPCSILKS